MKRKKSAQKFLLFFLYPFGGFLYALITLKNKSSLLVFFLWFVLFGYTFRAQNENADSFYYVQQFEREKSYTANYYIETIQDYFTFNSNIKDIYDTTSIFLVSRLTYNYHFLMAFWAAVFAFFYLKSFSFLVFNSNFKYALPFFLLAFIFAFNNPIFNINGVRFNTAVWIGVYSLFQIFINKKSHYFFLGLLTPLMHGSFMIFDLLLLVVYVTGKYENVWIALFITSFFVSLMPYLGLYYQYQDYFPTFIQHAYENYMSDDSIQVRLESKINLPLYAKIFNNLPRYFILGCTFLFIKDRKVFVDNYKSKIAFSILLIFLTFSNFAYTIPSLGGRFFIFVTPFVAYILVDSYQFFRKYNWLVYLIPFVYSYQLLQWYRNMMWASDTYLYISTSIHLFLKNLFIN